ncbi:bifunctional diguanylate cyclase/phosphodiesterase [Quadrisphaera sp. DSM 44207]|uniref:putative bifunctional diguanylate cyclase/phosphodiesterase n=1 Tax=Quadrisphaera sp. DSM 44207 TaxID=1881057 RepID=UPI00115FD68F|nr:bifunctional diguanylate cyclase/phosphodiesterase [Quadrisphaera sp. DSM 44207]
MPPVVAVRSLRAMSVATTLSGISGASVTVVLGVNGSVHAFWVGALLSAVLAVGGGLVLVRRSGYGGQRSAVRAAMGAAGLVWGAGQALVGLRALAAPGAPVVAGLGEVVCTAAGPLALASLLSFPRPAGPAGRRWRLALDALVIAAAGAALLWQTVYRQIEMTASPWLVVAVLLADLSILALGLQVSLAGLDRGVLLAAVGLSLFAVGDLDATRAVVQPGGTWPWQAAAAACLAWPLVAAGLLLAGAGPAGPAALRRISPEARTGIPATVVVLGLGAALWVSASADEDGLDRTGAALVVVLIVLFGVREALLQRQRLALVRSLTDQAERDFLTGLGNRRALSARMEALARRPERSSVVVIDLDGFKDVNDRVGHAAGDQLLVEAAAAMRDHLPAGWRCYRLGGDEFAATGPGCVVAAADVAAGLLTALRSAAVAVDGVAQVVVSASAGVAALPAEGAGEPLAALSEASTALQEAKRGGRDRVVVHSDEVAATARRRALVGRRLREALAEDSLDALLQPVVDIRTGGVVGFEVLSRWTDAELGVVPPDEFVPVAEQNGLVVQLGGAVLRRGLAGLCGAGGVERGLRLSVNASPLELRNPGYVAAVLGALHEAGVPCHLLVVEVTEAVYVTREDPAVATLEALAAEGVRIAVDDFGTGYSSLSYLGRLPVHLVKVDRSLTEQLAQTRTRAVVEALVRLSRALDLVVVAEGVEERWQAEALLDLGVGLGQGWLWSPGVPAGEAGRLLDGRAGGRVGGPALR